MKPNPSTFTSSLYLVFLLCAGAASAATWEPTLSFPVAQAGLDPVSSGSYLYAAGGPSSTVYMTPIAASGAVLTWTVLQNLPEADPAPGLAIANGWLYAVLSSGKVYRALVSATGSLGSWVSETAIDPSGMGYAGAVKSYRGYLYVFGRTEAGAPRNVIRFAPIQPDGSLAPWQSSSFLGEFFGSAIQFVGDRVYLTGGWAAGNGILSLSFSATVRSDGSLIGWAPESSLPASLWLVSSVTVSNRIILFGGLTSTSSSSVSTVIYEATVSEDGKLGAWAASDNMPSAFAARVGAVHAEANGFVYLLGGANATQLATDQVWAKAYSMPPVPNTPPVATPQSVTTPEAVSVSIVLSGTDAEGSALTYEIAGNPTHGILTGTAPSVTYTPDTGYSGSDAFTFRVYDGKDFSAPATVSITVTPANRAPTAYPQAVTLIQNSLKAILLTGSDPDQDFLSYAIVAGPAHGTIAGTPPNITYSPDSSYLGADEFSFKVNDGKLDSAPATVSLTVVPENTAPEARISVSPYYGAPANRQIIAGSIGKATVTLDGSASSDADDDELQFSWTEGAKSLGSAPVLELSFALGQHSIALQVSDGADSDRTESNFTVISAETAVEQLISEVQESALSKQKKQPLIASLSSAAASLERRSSASAIGQLGAAQQKLRGQVAPSNPALAQKWNALLNQILAAIKG